MNQDGLRELWGRLSVEAADGSARAIRSVSSSDIYASWNVDSRRYELLVAGVNGWIDDGAPRWGGMGFSLSSIGSSTKASYLVLELLSEELEVPFACFCADVIEAMESAEPERRLSAFSTVIDAWSQFFLEAKSDAMSENAQRGLYAELWWMRRQFVAESSARMVVDSWMGPIRRFHDFDVAGRVVEVKSTIRKEPRKVMISNERQLADEGLLSLHLFVLTLDIQADGESLPEMVEQVREGVRGEPAVLSQLNRKLVLARYLDRHAERYGSRYRPRHEEVFRVGCGFPRVASVEGGVGDLSYTVQISACKPFEEELGPAPWMEG